MTDPLQDCSLKSIDEAAKVLGVSKAALRAWTLAGCPVVRLGRLRRFILPELVAWLERREAQRQAARKGEKQKGDVGQAAAA
jgi:excisionase family DNA binding protein